METKVLIKRIDQRVFTIVILQYTAILIRVSPKYKDACEINGEKVVCVDQTMASGKLQQKRICSNGIWQTRSDTAVGKSYEK